MFLRGTNCNRIEIVANKNTLLGLLPICVENYYLLIQDAPKHRAMILINFSEK